MLYMCLCVLIAVCMLYDATLPCIKSEQEDSGEGMTRNLAYNVPRPLNQLFLHRCAFPLLLRPQRQGEPAGLMHHQQPLLTLEEGLLRVRRRVGLMYFRFSGRERGARRDTCHSARRAIKINERIETRRWLHLNWRLKWPAASRVTCIVIVVPQKNLRAVNKSK